ncbi:MAG: demethylmenaquinone methyltransferase [Candidatus Promineifilaceae bacterium]
MSWIILAIATAALLAALLYWALVITEGVFLGRRVVVWLYDITAHKYDRVKDYNPFAEEIFIIRPLRHRLRTIPAPRILDIATGTGRVPWFLLQETTFNGRVYGLDPSARMLALAQQKLRPYKDRASLVQQAVTPLPFAANTFHAVTCLESLEFFPSDEAALAEVERVLKPGGILLTTRRRGIEARLFLRRYRSEAAFADMLTQLGFTNVEFQPWQVEYDLIFAQKCADKNR